MNVSWMPLAAAVIAVEKVFPSERESGLAVAVLLVALGIVLGAAPGQVPAMTVRAEPR